MCLVHHCLSAKNNSLAFEKVDLVLVKGENWKTMLFAKFSLCRNSNKVCCTSFTRWLKRQVRLLKMQLNFQQYLIYLHSSLCSIKKRSLLSNLFLILVQSNLYKKSFPPKICPPLLIVLIGYSAGSKQQIGQWCQNSKIFMVFF